VPDSAGETSCTAGETSGGTSGGGGGGAGELSGEQLWERLLEAVADRPSMAWARSMSVAELTGDTLRVAMNPGHRDLAGFVTDAKRAQLTELLQSVTGRRLRITMSAAASGVVSAGASASAAGVSGGGASGGSASGGGASGGGEFESAPAEPGAATAGGSPSDSQRTKALDLPLVKQVIEVFDGASPVGISSAYNESQDSQQSDTEANSHPGNGESDNGNA